MVDRAHLIYFSPTRTTQQIVEQVAVGLGAHKVEHHDLTLARCGIIRRIDNGIAVIGTPVYAGRVPEICLARMQRLASSGTPAVLVALYGNREFEDALVELRDVALAKGFSVVAAGAFIGEHSYSTAEQPIAAGRPDAKDLEKAKAFGKAIAAKLRTGGPLDTPRIPGKLPYRERVPLGGVTPVTHKDLCTLCGTCARVCPTFIIEVDQEVRTAAKDCVMCCACVKDCPEQARTMNHPRVQERRELLIQGCSHRKEPAIFLE
ncbi:MAG: 4Fe-4S binding protein [Desulfuromonadales bacterium]|nr:4Fe-4S binding protein [Desulfuromonadales bacterium]